MFSQNAQILRNRPTAALQSTILRSAEFHFLVRAQFLFRELPHDAQLPDQEADGQESRQRKDGIGDEDRREGDDRDGPADGEGDDRPDERADPARVSKACGSRVQVSPAFPAPEASDPRDGHRPRPRVL